jgi:hypothetical protein
MPCCIMWMYIQTHTQDLLDVLYSGRVAECADYKSTTIIQLCDAMLQFQLLQQSQPWLDSASHNHMQHQVDAVVGPSSQGGVESHHQLDPRSRYELHHMAAQRAAPITITHYRRIHRMCATSLILSQVPTRRSVSLTSFPHRHLVCRAVVICRPWALYNAELM